MHHMHARVDVSTGWKCVAETGAEIGGTGAPDAGRRTKVTMAKALRASYSRRGYESEGNIGILFAARYREILRRRTRREQPRSQ